MLYLFTECH